MKRTSTTMASLVALTLAFAPAVAHARAGDSTSMGSRGANTFAAPPKTNSAPGGAAPMQRSMQQPAPMASAPGARPMAPQPQRSGFFSGFMGGLLTAGLVGMLFGHGFMGGGMGMFGFLGLILQILLVAFIVRLIWRLVAGSGPRLATAQGPDMYARQADGPMAGGPMGGGQAPNGQAPVTIAPADYQQFEQLLQGIQAAWSAHDLNGLRNMATPEMASYFAEQLADQASRGVHNYVTDVRLQAGDLAQAWSEYGRDYATVSMRFSMLDVTRDGSGRVVAGDPARPSVATEYWTFVRANGGRWILSAIQQTQ